MKLYLAFILIFCTIFNSALATKPRVLQIPNGTKNTCFNCHNKNPDVGDTTRNLLGKMIELNYLNNGNVVWGPALAKLDADGDGRTNGFELNDPDGTWKKGTKDPGDPSTVTNPGVVDQPSSVIDELLNNEFHVLSFSPNPMLNNITLSYSVQSPCMLFIAIYDFEGNLIKNLLFEDKSYGDYQIVWDGTDNSDKKVNSGVYFISIKSNNYLINKKIELFR